MTYERDETTGCVVVGGGPAGMMLAFLLSRRNVAVTVLEKHENFLRDFRGDTIHASTIELMEELGLGEGFLRVPHQVVTRLSAFVGGTKMTVADFSVLRGKHPHLFLMPQWDFLDFLANQAAKHPSFRLLMGAEVTELLWEGERASGVKYRAGSTTGTVRALLTVACDGRNSVLRAPAGLEPKDLGAPMDVLWFRIPRTPDDTEETGVVLDAGSMLVLINRGEYWQAAYVIAKGEEEKVFAEGLEAFRATLVRLAPFLQDGRLAGVKSWEDVKTLRVQVNRLRQWFKPGLLFLGDAAHAMSPIGGVGINLAIQDAVAAARILEQPLRDGHVTSGHLARVQARRWFPTVATQAMQRLLQQRVLKPLLTRRGPLRPPSLLPRVLGFPLVRRAVARGIAVGLRPERVART